jgi:NNP family nitrate/nitrite transporter-like MFS transporter
MGREGLRRFLQAGHVGTLFSAFVYFDVSFMVWVMIGALGVHISEDFSLTAWQQGLLVATPLLGGSLLRIPLGLAGDLFGPRRTATVALVLTILPLMLGWLAAASVESIFFIGLLLGIAGASFAVALPMASRAYPPQYQGAVMGIAGAGNSGTVLAALVAPRLAESMGWRGVFGAAVIPIAIALAVLRLAAKEHRVERADDPLKAHLEALRESDCWWFSLLYMITFGGFVGLASFLGIFFYDQFGVSKVAAGNLTALCVFAGSFARPVGGLLADRFGGIKALTGLLGLITMSMFLIGQLHGLHVTTALLFAAMALLGMGNGALFQLVPQRFPKDIGVVTGLVGAAGGVGGFALPFVLGFSKHATGSYGGGFILLSVAALVSLGLLVRVQRDWRENWASAPLRSFAEEIGAEE